MVCIKIGCVLKDIIRQKDWLITNIYVRENAGGDMITYFRLICNHAESTLTLPGLMELVNTNNYKIIEQ